MWKAIEGLAFGREGTGSKFRRLEQELHKTSGTLIAHKTQEGPLDWGVTFVDVGAAQL